MATSEGIRLGQVICQAEGYLLLLTAHLMMVVDRFQYGCGEGLMVFRAASVTVFSRSRVEL